MNKPSTRLIRKIADIGIAISVIAFFIMLVAPHPIDFIACGVLLFCATFSGLVGEEWYER